MAIFTISDLHLPLSAPEKTMEVFSGWTDYVRRLEENWRRLVSPEDTVVVGGDISWAMQLERAEADFRFLDSLPLQVTLKDGTVYDLTDTAGGSIDRQETQTVCSKDRQLPEIIALDDVASVTVGDCVIPVEL